MSPACAGADDEIQWMTEFDRALEDGMAIELPLDWSDGVLDRLVVLGLRALLAWE